MNNHWALAKHDFQFKSPAAIIRHLCACRKVGANYLLNIGPTAAGAIPAYEAAVVRKVGAWIELHGDLIQRGKPVGVKCAGLDFVLRDDARYYYFAHDLGRKGDANVVVPGEGAGPRVIAGFPAKVKSVRWLNGGEKVRFTQSADHTLLTLDCTGMEYGVDLVVRVAELAI